MSQALIQNGTLFIISAPSGAGKTSLVHKLINTLDDICVSISYTTRKMRAGEEHGKDYHFVSKQQFADMLANNEFLEHANVFGNSYGTSRNWVEQRLTKGIDVILEIDWQGAAQVRKLFAGSVSIFILPPSLPTLRKRLVHRAQDSKSVIDQRMAQAISEISHYSEFDFHVVNDDFELALKELISIIKAQRANEKVQMASAQQLINELLSKPL